MTGEDWTDYTTIPAPKTLLCQFRRKDRFLNHVGFAKDFLPEFNVVGLEWKLTGIAREQLDRMPEEVKQRMMPENYGGWVVMGMLAAIVQGSCAQMTNSIFADCWGGIRLK